MLEYRGKDTNKTRNKMKNLSRKMKILKKTDILKLKNIYILKVLTRLNDTLDTDQRKDLVRLKTGHKKLN